jgi:carboxylesterase type B
LGLLGWLAGSTVEKEGTPNAGLWDQRAVLEWINKYIDLFGGNSSEVSIWGESAGAGSIAHHLTAFGGEKPALFKRAVIESPAFDFQVDRKGQLEKQFKAFADYAGCQGKGIDCLRSANINKLMDAQKKQLDQVPDSKAGAGYVLASQHLNSAY